MSKKSVPHPSLSAQSAFLPLRPQAAMNRNDRCWCRSGKKWKHCHKDRELQSPINIFAQAEKMREEFSDGYCSFVDASGNQCSGKAISSHSVQKGGGLAGIQESGHVLSPKTTLENLVKHNGKPQIKSLGIKKASTFPGFCSGHDAQIFQQIEKPNSVLDRNTAFLLAYRSISLELFKKQAVSNTHPLLREMDRGLSFNEQVQLQKMSDAFEQGTKLGLSNITDWKNIYDKLLHIPGHPGFQYVAVFFDGQLPLVASTAWQVENDFAGNVLQRLGTTAVNYEHITFNLTRVGKEIAAVFGWVASDNGPSKHFVDSFQALPDTRKASMLALMSFEFSENIFMRPSWWHGLSNLERMMLENRILNGGTTKARKDNALLDNGYSTITASVLRTEEG